MIDYSVLDESKVFDSEKQQGRSGRLFRKGRSFYAYKFTPSDKQFLDLFVPCIPNVFQRFQLFILQTREFLLQEESKSVKLSHCKHDNYITISKCNLNTQKNIIYGLFSRNFFNPMSVITTMNV